MFFRSILIMMLALSAPMVALAQTVVELPPEEGSTDDAAVTTSGDTAEETEVAPPPPAPDPVPDTTAGKLTAGHRLYVGGDAAGALAAYEEAKQMEPGNATVYYFIGCAQAKLEKYDDAIASMRTAITIAGESDADTHGKALFSIAVIEEQRGDTDKIVQAWTDYFGFAQTHNNANVFQESAQSRLDAYKKTGTLKADYLVVRERVANK